MSHPDADAQIHAAHNMDVESTEHDTEAEAANHFGHAHTHTALLAPIAARANSSTMRAPDASESTAGAAGAGAAAAVTAPSRDPNTSPPATSSGGSSNKRHISTAVASYNANHRLVSPSPPKSPVRLRHSAAAAAADSNNNSSTSGAGFLAAPAAVQGSSHTSSCSNAFSASSSSSTSSSDSSNRSPIRIASRDRERSSALRSSSFHSPTRTTPHGLPASPITPTRLKNRQGVSNSASPPLTTTQHVGSRSPISAFYFPQGLPPSPGTKLTAQTTLRQLSKVHPQGFDADAIEQLCTSVLKLPRYLTAYVQQQCLSLQHNRAELRAAVQEQQRLELNRRRIQRQMDSLRRGGAAGRSSNRSSLGTLGAAVKNASLCGSGSDMSIDSLHAGAGLTSPVADRSAAIAAMAACKSPLSADDGRSRNVSTASTTSTALTALSPPDSPLDADAALNASSASASSTLLSPLSMSRVSACVSSTNNSLLQVSGLDEHDESADAAADAEEALALAADQLAQSTEDERVLPETFALYYSSYLEKFRDPHTRFFRVILGAIEHLFDAPEPSPAEASSISIGAAQDPPRMLQPLHIPSPRIACVPLSQPSAAAPAPCTSPLLSPSSSYLVRSHFMPMLDAILGSHPGLEFLHATPEFQLKYAQTCIERIFFTLDARGTGRLSLADVKRSNLLLEVEKLESDPDINKSLHYFSYQHFYVLYCRFWELDSPDHDGFLSTANLQEYENGALSTRICERIIQLCREEDSKRGVAVSAADDNKDSGMDAASVCPSEAAADEFPASDRGSDADLHTPVMDYAHFIPFMLAEVDKNTAPSLSYWFRALDLDHDHVLSLYELDWFFSEQKEKIQALSSDVIRWNDIVCQLLDMIKNGDDGSSTQRVRPHQVGGSTALPPASGSLQRNVSAETEAMRASASDVMSVEFSSCLITRKDLARSHLASYFFNLFFNLPRFLNHESRDPARARSLHEAAEKGISEWEVYAAGMYQSLVANEELQARAAEQLQSAGPCEGQEDELEPHMEDSEVAAAASGHHAHEEDEVAESEHNDGGEGGHHSPHVVRRSAARSARSQQHMLEEDEDEDSDMHDERQVAQRAHHSAAAAEQAATIVHVVPGSAPGAPPTFFVVDDEPIEDAAPEVPSSSLARAHQPSRPGGAGTVSSPAASKQQQLAASQRAARLRQEEQEYLEMQRKIHHSSLRDTSPLSAAAAALDEEEELERIASPPASSRPISIRTSGGGSTSPQLQKLHIHSPLHATTSPIEAAAAAAASADDDADDDEHVASSVSPPYTAPSAAPRSSAAHVLQSISATQSSAAMQDDSRASSAGPFALRSPTSSHSHNKENPESPPASALIASTPSAFKRQLMFAGNVATAAADKQPLSPTTQQHR